MVDISQETPLETETRLRRLLADVQPDVLPGLWAYREYSLDAPPQPTRRTLALVRDDSGWCSLEPASGEESEIFGAFVFHFPKDRDNSGFVGWLATELKQHLGTGVAVVCGYNSMRGGIYDYWLVPHQLCDQSIEHIRNLASQGA